MSIRFIKCSASPKRKVVNESKIGKDIMCSSDSKPMLSPLTKKLLKRKSTSSRGLPLSSKMKPIASWSRLSIRFGMSMTRMEMDGSIEKK